MPNFGFLLKAVVGNGMTLGLTNGNVESGLRYTTSQYPRFQSATDSIGSLVGDIIHTPSNNFSDDKMVGVTTDPIKSGVEVKVSDDVNYIIKY